MRAQAPRLRAGRLQLCLLVRLTGRTGVRCLRLGALAAHTNRSLAPGSLGAPRRTPHRPAWALLQAQLLLMWVLAARGEQLELQLGRHDTTTALQQQQLVAVANDGLNKRDRVEQQQLVQDVTNLVAAQVRAAARARMVVHTRTCGACSAEVDM